VVENPFKKNSKKMLTPPLPSGIVALHTVTTRTTTTHKMRTKTLLLSAGALLAAGFVSSQAQPVYSQNIVGYASLAAPGGANTMMTVPFNIGVSNGANEVFGTNLPVGSTILLYSTAATTIPLSNVGDALGVNGTLPVQAQSYITYYYDPSSVSYGYGAWWSDGSELNNMPTPSLPVGQGFFISPNGTFTNTFAGTVAVPVGTTNSMTLPGGQNTLVGSAIPFAGDITAGTAGALTNNLPAGSTVLVYSTAANTIPLTNVGDVLGANGTLNVPAASYVTYFYDPSSVSYGYGAWWTDGSELNNMPAPSLTVGQAMFIVPNGNFNWKQTLPSN
jgi:hypothetical protein